jgi:hypothetical protein
LLSLHFTKEEFTVLFCSIPDHVYRFSHSTFDHRENIKRRNEAQYVISDCVLCRQQSANIWLLCCKYLPCCEDCYSKVKKKKSIIRIGAILKISKVVLTSHEDIEKAILLTAFSTKLSNAFCRMFNLTLDFEEQAGSNGLLFEFEQDVLLQHFQVELSVDAHPK